MLINRTAGAGRNGQVVAETAGLLESRGFRVRQVTSGSELASAIAPLVEERQLRAVLACGGDGTVGIALNYTPPGVPLGVFPAGTENLLAKYLRQRARPESVLALLTEGEVVHLDAGLADDRLFALMVSVGFDADIVHRVHSRRRGNITHLAYARPILEAIHAYSYPPFRVVWHGPQGAAGESTGKWLFAMNLPQYAQGLPISPGASGVDGLLDLSVFQRGHASSAVWYLWHLMRRRHHRLPSVSIQSCHSVRIESLGEVQAPYQLDGDPGGFLPVNLRVAPGRLTCVVAPGVARRLGFAAPADPQSSIQE